MWARLEGGSLAGRWFRCRILLGKIFGSGEVDEGREVACIEISMGANLRMRFIWSIAAAQKAIESSSVEQALVALRGKVLHSGGSHLKPTSRLTQWKNGSDVDSQFVLSPQ